MTNETAATVQALYRYPVKGLTPELLPAVRLIPGATMPFDRAYAIENGPGPFDPAAPKYVPKFHFVMLMRNEQLAALRTSFNDTTHVLTVRHDGRDATQGDLRTPDGRANIEAFVAGFIGKALRGPPRIVASNGHSFSDVSAKCLHIVNLASVRALEAAMGASIDPRRFRPNIVIDGLPAWSELDLVGSKLRAGAATLDIFKRTERCAATNVDPKTGIRDLKIPSFLSRTYGHTDFGVYARVATGGDVRANDAVAVAG